VFLALATFGFGVLLEQMFYPMRFMFGSTGEGVPVPRPGGGIGPWHFSSDKGFYYVLLVFTVLTVVALAALERGRLGRLLRALADSPTALQTNGTTLTTTLTLVFCVSAFFAGISGALTASLFQYAVSTQFSSFGSLTLFAIVVIVIMGEPWYALVGAALMTLVPAYWTGRNVNTYLQLAFGISAAVYVFTARRPLGVPARIRAALERHGGRRAAPAAVVLTDDEVLASRPPARLRAGLEIRDLTVRYGGVVAVDGVSLVAHLGAVTGLIGPNGAGKTTTFNACSGLLRPTTGSISLDDRDVTALGPPSRARRGLGRTFQRVELFDSLTVSENVEMGREAALAGGSPTSQLLATRGDRELIRRSVDEAVALTGIGALLGTQVGLLPTGQRRLVELARALAGPFEMLLLDEPSSGLDAAETTRFGEILRRAVRTRGLGILLVEHDMALVHAVCDRVYVLDFGVMIFQGSPAEMRASETVRAAYLGSDSIDAALPGVAT
jgi:ABC-type branched-subunit amino acid transport system ATPase component